MESGGTDVVLHTHAVLAREARMARMLLDAARSLGETLVPERVYDRFREILADAVRYDGVIVSSYDAGASRDEVGVVTETGDGIARGGIGADFQRAVRDDQIAAGPANAGVDFTDVAGRKFLAQKR